VTGDHPLPYQLLTDLLFLRGLKEAKGLGADQPYPLLLGRVTCPEEEDMADPPLKSIQNFGLLEAPQKKKLL
jgi:hypothetical protein